MPNHIKENRVRREFGSAPLHASQLASPLTRTPGTVNPALGGIALYLTTDRRAARTKRPGNLSDTGALALQLIGDSNDLKLFAISG